MRVQGSVGNRQLHILIDSVEKVEELSCKHSKGGYLQSFNIELANENMVQNYQPRVSSNSDQVQLDHPWYELTQTYSKVFQTPKGLPPTRPFDPGEMDQSEQDATWEFLDELQLRFPDFSELVSCGQEIFEGGSDSMGILKEYITKHNVPNDVLDDGELLSKDDDENAQRSMVTRTNVKPPTLAAYMRVVPLIAKICQPGNWKKKKASLEEKSQEIKRTTIGGYKDQCQARTLVVYTGVVPLIAKICQPKNWKKKKASLEEKSQEMWKREFFIGRKM
nr:hypothetical protein [Tanacetum cinerariifolium]